MALIIQILTMHCESTEFPEQIMNKKYEMPYEVREDSPPHVIHKSKAQLAPALAGGTKINPQIDVIHKST